MKRLFVEALTWACLAVILGAAMGNPIALRMEGSVEVLVGIMNALILVILLAMLFSTGVRKSGAERSSKQHPAYRAYVLISSAVWLCVLAFAGWHWSFGIRGIWLVMSASIQEVSDAS